MSGRNSFSVASLTPITSSSDPLVTLQKLNVPGRFHPPIRRRSSQGSLTSPYHGRQGGLRRHRLSQWRITPLRGQQLSPAEKLRRMLRSILIIVEVCLALKKYVKSKEKIQQLTLREMQLNLQDDLNKRLTFNPHYYSASYVANKGSSKLRKMLAIAPEARTKRHVKMIHTLVQNKNAFSKHPVHIRLKMCQVMIYQSYESRRVIIKQGHPPSAFYIVLSGTCLINTKETGSRGDETTQTVNELKEGDVFGEVALLNKTTRTATVVCKDDVELLVIYKEDFDAIIRGPIYKQREEVIEYCQHLPILRDWPVNLLAKASIGNFQHQYYRKGTVVVKNNLESNFLVFIKSGECRVVCTLDGCEPEMRGKARSQSLHSTPFLPFLDNDAKNRVKVPRSMSLCATNLRFQRSFQSNLHAIPDANENIQEDDKDFNLRNSARKRRFDKDVDNEKKNGLNQSKDFNKRQQKSSLKSVDVLRGSTSPERTFLAVDNFKNVEKFPHLASSNLDYPSLSRDKNSLWRSTSRPSVFEDTPYALAKKRKSSFLRDRWRKAATVLKAYNSSDEIKPKFAQIAVLSPGYVFGMEEMMKRTQLRLSLISDGAECIFISKKMFLKHAEPQTLRSVNGVIGRYPTEEYIRHQLGEQAEWSNFRKEVIKDVLVRRDEKIDLLPYLQAN